MLGCKCGPHSNIRQEHVRELIDTCWDVNANSATNTNTGTSELIDTCWDVNDINFATRITAPTELIDTCWDVNQEIS